MNLIEENLENAPKPDSSKKISRIILIAILILVIVTVGLCAALYAIKKNTLVLTLDGKTNDKVKEMLIIEDDGTIWVPIKKIASYFGYESYNGDYISKSEDQYKCWVQVKDTQDEIANFSLNSKKIYKITNDQKQGSTYSYYDIDKEVISKNGELYATTDGIEKAFNVSFSYDQENKKIKIYTMPYLISSYEKKVLDWGYTQISQDFNDQKTILKNMLIVKKGKDSSSAKYGVLDVSKNGENVLEAKYSNISYVPDTSDFLVEDNKKVGLLSSSGQTKIRIDYDEINILDSESKLYVVAKNKKYGVVDSNGQVVITLDYDDIGVDLTKFPKNDVKNKYLLADNLIPLKKGDYWGFADKNGNTITDFQFDSLGYIASSNKDTENLLVIEDYGVVVACKDKKYILVNSLGKLLWGGAPFEDVYMTASSTDKKYYLVKNGKTYDAEEQLDKIGAKTSSKSSESTTSNNSDTNTSNDTSNNTNTNTSNKNTNTNN